MYTGALKNEGQIPVISRVEK